MYKSFTKDVCHSKKKNKQTKELWFMVFNATFNNISATCISWQSVLLVQETGVPEENLQSTNKIKENNIWETYM
jgi:hypothetical protein